MERQNEGIRKTFLRMFTGLLITGISAYIAYATGLYMRISYILLGIIELGVVLLFTFLFRKLSPQAVSGLFYGYSIINGVTMGSIFASFNIGTIFYAFFTASLLFGALALYGHNTQKDLSKFGTVLTVAVFVGFITSIINLFMGNPIINIILDWAMLLVFSGLVAHDMQNIKNMQNYVDCDDEKLYVYCAMDLYLDFINIFIRLLSIFARFQSDED